MFFFVEMQDKLENEEAVSTENAQERAKLIEQYQVSIAKISPFVNGLNLEQIYGIFSHLMTETIKSRLGST